jgi:hypothetical protein
MSLELRIKAQDSRGVHESFRGKDDTGDNYASRRAYRISPLLLSLWPSELSNVEMNHGELRRRCALMPL